ncbi:LacI family DNA-binding transcriptional regulator [Peterkaempfera bronchialis]|uniref:LacI family DNA-binding transcriptional regulator n=1 Tax=Peterkaempfera bronchialis TaxID=2126346 RepID=UPI0013B3C9A5|nr:LacI family DNA-binding transcriptional regulator [Peterkaempfera bronchialis]
MARAAGVSVTTVSHVLNGKGAVAPATRERILRMADELRYRANPVAQSLRGGRTGLIALAIRPLDAIGYTLQGVDHFVRLAGAAATTALDRGFGLMLVPDLTRSSVPAAMNLDGGIVVDPFVGDPVLAELLDQGLPVVSVGRDPARPEHIWWAGTDDRAETRRMLDLLVARGGRRIAFVAGTDDNAWNHDSIAAYLAWAEERGQEPILERVPEQRGEEGGTEVAGVLFSRPAPPDAVLANTGRHAVSIARVAMSLGWDIPGRLLVAAGSDSEHTRFATPGITALELAPEATGRLAVELLLERLAGGAEPVPPRIAPAVLHERASTARAL